MSRWFNWFLAVVSAIASIFGIGGFFGVDARWVAQNMTAHYTFLLISVVSLAVFAWSVRALWRHSRITPDNVHAKVRGWLDAFNYVHRLAPWEPWHFGFEVTLARGPLLFIAQPKAHADYLMLMGKITAVSPHYRSAFNALTESQREKFYGQLRLETARAKIIFSSDPSLN
jgi:hypothetical protein